MNDKVNWIPVGDLAESFAPDSNVLSRSIDLVGETIDLALADGRHVALAFLSPDRLRWTPARSEGVEEDYLATSLRPGLFFVDLIRGSGATALSISLVIDRDAGVATLVEGRLPDAATAHGGLLDRAQQQRELTAVEVAFTPACIGRAYDAAAPFHRPTDELVGLRLRHRYSPTELYEHIYLNPQRYAWHCLQGSEQGLADVDRCHYYKLREKLYLFVWREKVIPTLGVVLLDLQALKTTGKIVGYTDDAMTTLSNFPVGARSIVMNVTPPAGD